MVLEQVFKFLKSCLIEFNTEFVVSRQPATSFTSGILVDMHFWWKLSEQLAHKICSWLLLNFTTPREGVDFQKKLEYFSKLSLPPQTIQVSFSNNHIKLNTIQNIYYKHMALIFSKIKIIFINQKISLLHFLFKNYLI